MLIFEFKWCKLWRCVKKLVECEHSSCNSLKKKKNQKLLLGSNSFWGRFDETSDVMNVGWCLLHRLTDPFVASRSLRCSPGVREQNAVIPVWDCFTGPTPTRYELCLSNRTRLVVLRSHSGSVTLETPRSKKKNNPQIWTLKMWIETQKYVETLGAGSVLALHSYQFTGM